MKKLLFILFVIAAGAVPSIAMMANWPASIVGTWQGVANQSNVKLIIKSQGTVGACEAITGTMSNLPSGGDSNIQGFYCPATGHLTFVRKDINNNSTFQSYSGSLADIGPELRMAGTFGEVNFVGHLGDYGLFFEKRE
ncbi:MAG TPA: hypothetical protein VFK06_11175 [Candidatus Angelobacter sp.]|nr:hypothetical protein [Candidatus Angelobacter sp.]